MKKKISIKWVKIFLVTVCMNVEALPVNAGNEEVPLDNVISVDLNLIKKKADVIMIGKLVAEPLPYEVFTKDFYRIKSDGVIKGKLDKNSLLIVITQVDSSEGSSAKVELNKRYMLFLQKIDLSSEGLPEKFAAYCLVGNWKGIISLDKTATERRSIRRIEMIRER